MKKTKLSVLLLSASMLAACGAEKKEDEQAVEQAVAPQSAPVEMINLNTFEAYAVKEKDAIKNFFGNLDAYHRLASAPGVNPEVWENSAVSHFNTIAGIAPKKLDSEYNNEFDAGSVSGYLMGVYANNASPWVQKGNVYTRAYSCENAVPNDLNNGYIVETINNVASASKSDISDLRFEKDNVTRVSLNNCRYGRMSANGVFSLEIVSSQGDITIPNSQSKIEALAKYIDLTVTADGIYKANGDKTLVVDTLNSSFAYYIGYRNYYAYSKESDVEFSETLNGRESFTVNGNLYNIIIDKVGLVNDNGRTYQHNLKTGYPFVGETLFPADRKWTIDSPTQGSLSIDVDGHNITLTTLSKGSILVKLDNSDKDSKYIRW